MEEVIFALEQGNKRLETAINRHQMHEKRLNTVKNALEDGIEAGNSILLGNFEQKIDVLEAVNRLKSREIEFKRVQNENFERFKAEIERIEEKKRQKEKETEENWQKLAAEYVLALKSLK